MVVSKMWPQINAGLGWTIIILSFLMGCIAGAYAFGVFDWFEFRIRGLRIGHSGGANRSLRFLWQHIQYNCRELDDPSGKNEQSRVNRLAYDALRLGQVAAWGRNAKNQHISQRDYPLEEIPPEHWLDHRISEPDMWLNTGGTTSYLRGGFSQKNVYYDIQVNEAQMRKTFPPLRRKRSPEGSVIEGEIIEVR